MRWKTLLILLSLLVAPAARADPAERAFHAPDHLKLQTGGYLGFATVGLGLAAFEDHLNLTGYYGWVPQGIGGNELNTFALLVTGRAPRAKLDNLRWIPAYAGLGALYIRGDGFFVVLPDRYPDGYYWPTGIRALGVIGSEVELHVGEGADVASHGLYVEVVAVDVLVDHWAHNRGSVSLLDALSTGFGYKLRWP